VLELVGSLAEFVKLFQGIKESAAIRFSWTGNFFAGSRIINIAEGI